MKIRFVLQGTTHPGNIGAAARAIKTMGFSDLALVQPRHFPSADATARAAGADDVLAATRVVASLDEALADCRLVLGASARMRHIQLPMLDPREAAFRVRDRYADTQVGIVFGPERSGLSNEALARCHALVHIPVNEGFRSLNLAAAVQVIAYELHGSMLAGTVPDVGNRDPDAHRPATAERLQGFFEHLQRTLEQVEFFRNNQSTTMKLRLRRLFNRARPGDDEIDILRGILSAVERKLDGKR